MNTNTCMYGCNPFMSNDMQCGHIYSADPLCGLIPAYSYVPYQRAGKLYCDDDALMNGTIFPELNKPLGVYGKEFCKNEEC